MNEIEQPLSRTDFVISIIMRIKKMKISISADRTIKTYLDCSVSSVLLSLLDSKSSKSSKSSLTTLASGGRLL